MKNINNLKIGKEKELCAVLMAWIQGESYDSHKFIYQKTFLVKYISCDYVICHGNGIILNYE